MASQLLMTMTPKQSFLDRKQKRAESIHKIKPAKKEKVQKWRSFKAIYTHKIIIKLAEKASNFGVNYWNELFSSHL